MDLRKEDLKNGMIIQTTHNRFGVVEIQENRIDVCYDPDSYDNDKVLEKISLDNIFEYGNGQLGIGCILTADDKEKYSECYRNYNVGDTVIFYEIVAVYGLNKIYDNGEGIYPGIKLE